MLEDLFSRKIVGDEVHEQESGELAAELLQRTLLRENCLHTGLVLHSDNGSLLTAKNNYFECSFGPYWFIPPVSRYDS